MLQWTRFISGFLLPRSLLTTILHMQFWRVNQTLVYGFWMDIHFLAFWNSLAFSGSKENVSFLLKFVNVHVIDSLSSWLWENHFKVEKFKIFIWIQLIFLCTAQQSFIIFFKDSILLLHISFLMEGTHRRISSFMRNWYDHWSGNSLLNVMVECLKS